MASSNNNENPCQFIVDILSDSSENQPPRPTSLDSGSASPDMLGAFSPAAQAAAQAPPPPPPPPPAPTLSATLLYSRVSKNILCMEAGKELVDLVVGFLTLPLGCVVKLLQAIEVPRPEGAPPVLSSKHDVKPLVGITSLFNCTDKLEESRLCSSKTLLVDPRPTMTFGGKVINISGTEGAAIYCCGAPAACEFITKKPDLSCPKHKRKMENPCKVLSTEDDVAAAAAAAAGGKGKEEAGKKGKKGAAPIAEAPPPPGYIKAGGSYMIMNTLEVFPSSTIQSILKLGTQKGEKMSDLESMEIAVSGEEVVQMLKASLTSTNVLNDVFGKHCKKPLATGFGGLSGVPPGTPALPA